MMTLENKEFELAPEFMVQLRKISQISSMPVLISLFYKYAMAVKYLKAT